MAPMPSAGRYGTGSGVLDNKLYVAGGFGDGVGYTKLLEVYDPTTNSWATKASMVQNQYHPAAEVLNGQLYTIGGSTPASIALKLVEVYDPTTDTWTSAPELPTARSHVSAEVVGNKIYVMCGYNGTTGVATHDVFTPPACAASLGGLVGWWSGDGDARDHTGVNNGTLHLLSGHSGIAVGHVGQAFTFRFHLPSLISASAQTNLRLLHLEGAALVDRTTGRVFSSSTLCSSVTSLSPFVIAAASTPTAAPASISGRITTPNGQTLGGVLVTLNGAETAFAISDAQGQYRFTDLQLGDFYTVMPSLANHTFSPAERSFALVGNRNDAVFTALADAAQTANPLDSPEFFVRQHYLDFLGREPDAGGLRYWANEIRACSPDAYCANSRRTRVSAAFFVEQEFQRTASFVYRLYKASLGRQPNYSEFAADRVKVLGGVTLEEQQQRFAAEWVMRGAFKQQYPDTMTASEFVNRLFDTAELTLFENRQQQIESLTQGRTRAEVLRDLIELPEFRDREYNPSFVLMHYFAYLRRDAEEDGYTFWLNVLHNREPNNYHGMVCAFITSTEYQQRFSPIVTHSNAECGR